MSKRRVNASMRRYVSARANNCCEYCRLNQADEAFSFAVDHIVSEKHGGLTRASNLAWSCPHCNIHKGSDIAGADPETGTATFLYHPRQEKWDNHFTLEGATILATTPQARLTVLLLRMNDPDRLTEREDLIALGRYPC